ncbi:hypothetical protein CDL15_Pgr005190 [Punica granatum]|uniref:Uncharacterized protein n=1 Tax=Punica granatum TaxID=22663 RepID=A0A218WQH2_PUNGR|nr:hypothetical protein CDL15_Pgr005190 [Punica granatum]
MELRAKVVNGDADGDLELVADVRGRGEAAGGVAAEEGGVRKRRKGGVHSTLLSQSRRSRRCRAVTSSLSEIFQSHS